MYETDQRFNISKHSAVAGIAAKIIIIPCWTADTFVEKLPVLLLFQNELSAFQTFKQSWFNQALCSHQAVLRRGFQTL